MNELEDNLDIYEMQKYEIISYKQILKWETQKSSYFNRVMGIVSNPIYYMFDKIGQKNIQTIEKTVGSVIEYLYRVADLTVSKDRLIKRLKKHGIHINDLAELQKCYLKQLDECNQNFINVHAASAAIQGGIAGIAGELAAPADLSAILVRIFNMIQHVAFCYGFNPNDPIEKEIILSIMLLSLVGDRLKKEILKEICLLRKKEQESRGEHYTKLLTKRAMARIVRRFSCAILLKLFSRAVPVICVVVSAHSNYEMVNTSYDAAFMLYRKHFIERKHELRKYLVIEQTC
ncbi:MAG: EcsC family protein [Desulfamplus sp.]|nr:EcsC family protein [Desulfamplus sp.]